MKNYLTRKSYGTWNSTQLFQAGYNMGSEFITFKQALKIDGITGKGLKGLKAVVTESPLYTFREVESKVTKGKMVKEKFYFRVFYAPEVLARINHNTEAA